MVWTSGTSEDWHGHYNTLVIICLLINELIGCSSKWHCDKGIIFSQVLLLLFSAYCTYHICIKLHIDFFPRPVLIPHVKTVCFRSLDGLSSIFSAIQLLGEHTERLQSIFIIGYKGQVLKRAPLCRVVSIVHLWIFLCIYCAFQYKKEEEAGLDFVEFAALWKNYYPREKHEIEKNEYMNFVI